MSYLIDRLLQLLPVWIGISLLAFSLTALLPGDPAVVLLQRQTGEIPTERAVQDLRRKLQLDESFPVRYGAWLADAVVGDLGHSFRSGERVLPLLLGRFGRTMILAATSLLLALAVAVPAGILAGIHRTTLFDHFSRVGVLLGSSLPSFWLGYLLILLFSLRLGWLPVAGRGGVEHIILPAMTLALGTLAVLTRLVRASVLEELGKDYVRTARAKGLSDTRVLTRHLLPNALIPLVTVAGVRLGHLIAGAVVVETVFAWPGIGKLVIDAIHARDFPVIQGFVLVTGTIFVLINLVVDLLYRVIDPRLKLERREGSRAGA